jgi:predicted nuclease with TOPRIM domain
MLSKVNKKRRKVKVELNEERSKKKVLKDEHEELKEKHYTLLTRYAELERVNSDLEASRNDLEADHDDLESVWQMLTKGSPHKIRAAFEDAASATATVDSQAAPTNPA